jgi:hypothetical protein
MKASRIIVAVAASCVLSGCGAILHGANQDIDVQTSPAGAKVETSPATGTYTTPTRLTLQRKNNYVLTFTSPGYTPATYNIHNSIGTGTVIADVLLTGLVGVIVDGLTGSWYGLSPESATATLTRLTGTGPEEIHVHVGASNSGSTIELAGDAPGVKVQVTRQ